VEPNAHLVQLIVIVSISSQNLPQKCLCNLEVVLFIPTRLDLNVQQTQVSNTYMRRVYTEKVIRMISLK